MPTIKDRTFLANKVCETETAWGKYLQKLAIQSPVDLPAIDCFGLLQVSFGREAGKFYIFVYSI